MTITSSRAEDVDFAVPYFRSEFGIVTRAAIDVPDLKTARDQTWVAQRGTTQVQYIAEVHVPAQFAVNGWSRRCGPTSRPPAMEPESMRLAARTGCNLSLREYGTAQTLLSYEARTKEPILRAEPSSSVPGASSTRLSAS